MLKYIKRLFEKRSDKDKALRERVKSHMFNGGYATLICRRCEGFLTSQDGNTDTCKIVNKCNVCKGFIEGRTKLGINDSSK